MSCTAAPLRIRKKCDIKKPKTRFMLATYSTLTVAIKFKNISNKFCQLLSGKSKSIKLHFYSFQYAKNENEAMKRTQKESKGKCERTQRKWQEEHWRANEKLGTFICLPAIYNFQLSIVELQNGEIAFENVRGGDVKVSRSLCYRPYFK